MLVLAILFIFLQMQTVFDLPMSQNVILKLRRSHNIKIKIADVIVRFQRQSFPPAANLLVWSVGRALSEGLDEEFEGVGLGGCCGLGHD
jgi:hypothetical protein